MNNRRIEKGSEKRKKDFFKWKNMKERSKKIQLKNKINKQNYIKVRKMERKNWKKKNNKGKSCLCCGTWVEKSLSRPSVGNPQEWVGLVNHS